MHETKFATRNFCKSRENLYDPNKKLIQIISKFVLLTDNFYRFSVAFGGVSTVPDRAWPIVLRCFWISLFFFVIRDFFVD